MNLLDVVFERKLLGGGEKPKPDETKPVKFFDYDGTLLYSFTPEELEELPEMPANPTHEGLTAQGWNWTLADAKTYAKSYGILIVGQMYVTTDGKTRIYIQLEEGALSPWLGLCVDGTVTIDWGDGSEEDTLKGTSTSTLKDIQHVYSNPGGYVIALTVAEGSTVHVRTSNNDSAGTQLLYKKGASDNYEHRPYQNAIRKIEIGENMKFRGYSLCRCFNLDSITVPAGDGDVVQGAANYSGLRFITLPPGHKMWNYEFANSAKLEFVSFPINTQNSDATGSLLAYCKSLKAVSAVANPGVIPASFVSGAEALTQAVIPLGITEVKGSAFSGCYSLSKIVVPQSVVSMGDSAFNSCYGLQEIHFKSAAPPTAAGSWTFRYLPTSCKIFVPTGSLADYTSATNYPNPANYTYVEEE